LKITDTRYRGFCQIQKVWENVLLSDQTQSITFITLLILYRFVMSQSSENINASRVVSQMCLTNTFKSSCLNVELTADREYQGRPIAMHVVKYICI